MVPYSPRIEPHVRIYWKGKQKRAWVKALKCGFERHGLRAVLKYRVPADEMLWPGCIGVVATWGWRLGIPFREHGFSVLVMENPYVGDKESWISLGWNGLNGRATFPKPLDSGERWERNFRHMLQPWKAGGEYVLLIGQVRGDTSLSGVEIEEWYQDAAERLRWRFRPLPVVFRPHPEDPKTEVPGIATLECDLVDALLGAAVVVTFNSRVGVDAALAGVPVIACDAGSMAWPVAAHGLDAPLVQPDRSEWCRQLGWCQWTMEEIRSGLAWNVLRHAQ
jgi:hypothetical protein